MKNKKATVLVILLATVSFACASGDAQKNATASTVSTAPTSAGTPSNKFTAADIAKLKWIEGTWRGMDGDKPFYERYKVEEYALVTETLNEDGSVDGAPERWELKNGEFRKGEGENGSAASEITDAYIQFVPMLPGRGNNFRFVKQPHGWDAILEWPATPEKPARQKIYKMEPWSPIK
jgi:hypothetical protein